MLHEDIGDGVVVVMMSKHAIRYYHYNDCLIYITTHLRLKALLMWHGAVFHYQQHQGSRNPMSLGHALQTGGLLIGSASASSSTTCAANGTTKGIIIIKSKPSTWLLIGISSQTNAFIFRVGKPMATGTCKEELA